MPAVKDYYDLLGVSRGASEKDIRQAYRKLARKYHPDVNPGDKSAEQRFKEIQEAYDVLNDKEKRQMYDRFGANWKNAGRGAPSGAGRSSRPQGGYRTTYPGGEGFEYDIDFETPGGRGAGGDIGSIFERLFGRGSGAGTASSRRASRGQDLEQPVEITLEEAYQGTTRRLQLDASEPCPQCNGTGVYQSGPCMNCSGTGLIQHAKRLEVKIPAGVDTSSRVRVAGEGGYGTAGGARGDLYLVVTVRPHATYERKGDELHVEVPVPLTLAVLGGEVEVPTLKGKISLRIPPETQNGRTFRLAGRGMPRLKDGTFGDMFARVKVVLPTGLSERERELFEELRRLRHVA
jgi:DnaJ-class molecular chaperone